MCQYFEKGSRGGISIVFYTNMLKTNNKYQVLVRILKRTAITYTGILIIYKDDQCQKFLHNTILIILKGMI